MTLMYHEHQIMMDGCYNFRDLGGFPTDSGTTAYQKYYRADALGALTEKDISHLKALGISTIIDLRRKEEILEEPEEDCLVKAGFSYIHLSLLGDTVQTPEDFEKIPTLDAMYIDLLKNQSEKFKQITNLLLNANGGVVFHCTAGKDRTGVTAALLLNLAGVDRSYIVDSYAKSAPLLRPKFEQMGMASIPEDQREIMDLVTARFLGSEPEYMEKTLDYLERNFKNADNYFNYCGVTAGERSDLKERLSGGLN